MAHPHIRWLNRFFLLCSAALVWSWASAQNVVIQDNFTGATAQQQWSVINGACLTAGASTVISGTNTIPACVGNPYYAGVTLKGGQTGSLPDPVGSGALRFTNNSNSENGAIISNLTTRGQKGFPLAQGVAVTFSTVTYGGTGADGISFFLLDASVPLTLVYPSQTGSGTQSVQNLGAWGGSLAYSCSNANGPYNGLEGAYIGLGMDEYGNFMNGSNPNTGYNGDNTSSGSGFVKGRIGIRGSGNTNWHWLNANYPSLYPSNMPEWQRQEAVQNTCATGMLWDDNAYTTGTVDAVVRTASGGTTTITTSSLSNDFWVNGAVNRVVNNNYAAMPGSTVTLPLLTPLFTTATTRPAAKPVTYQLKITQNGLLSLAYSYNGGSYQPVLTNQPINSTTGGTGSFSNGPLPAYVQFGFAGSTGGANNIHEVTCFQAGPAELSSSSAGINTQQSGQVKTGTQVYLAYYHTNNWWGQLTSQNLTYDPVAQVVSISPTANWDASCVLTGGTCNATGATNMTAQGSGSRTILSWNPATAAGQPFQWNSLSASQQASLTTGDNPVNSNRLLYLRGDRSNEITTTVSGITGIYRARTSVLGDIVDSSPVWVGPPSSPFPDAWSDNIYGTATFPENAGTTQTYSNFVATSKTRLNVVYAGADDGLLHGFRAGAYDSSGNYLNNASYPNDGQEVLAYMPGAIAQSIHTTTAALDYSNPQYSHAFSVDATPYQGDLFYQNAWHTWLVGGLGPGGKAIYALDVTDPSQFSETNASSLVKGEWTPASLNGATCYVNGSISTTCGNNMGNTYGTPQVRRFHNGMWGFVFGNGFKSASGKAGIYVVTIDPSTAAQKVYYLDTGVGSVASPNGIAFVTPANIDGDHIIDYVYAGDLQGNVWRFDLTSSNPPAWAASKFGKTVATPLFTTPAGQPISTQAVVAITPALSGPPRVMVDFGTGLQVPQTVSSAATYSTATQSLYGIWDWDMANWNSLQSAAPMASLTGTQTITTSNLKTQSITFTQATNGAGGVNGYRTVSNSPVCWQGSSDCASSNNKYGWSLTLPATQEQVIYSPILSQGAFIVNTTVPANNTPLNCTANINQGWTMAITPNGGSAFKQSFFGDASNNFINASNGGQVSGIALGAVGSPSTVFAGGKPYLVNQNSTGTGDVRQVNPPAGGVGSRLTWQQIR